MWGFQTRHYSGQITSINLMQEPFFKPWVGDNYQGTKPKILILGESHYSEPKYYSPEFTKDVIRRLALCNEKSHPFFTKIAKILLGKPYEWIGVEQKHTLWHQVAFYNYIQVFVGETSRVRPTQDMWAGAAEALSTVMKQLEPDIIIITGKELRCHVKPVLENYSGSATFCYWTHPSSRAFNNDKAKAIRDFQAANQQYAG